MLDRLSHGRVSMSDNISRIAVKFLVENVGEAEGELVRYLAPRTVDALVRAIPVNGRAAVWKEEVYFKTSVQMELEKPRATVDMGTIAYWPMGTAICVFYGKTQPYSQVSCVGRIVKNLDLFSHVKPGFSISMLKG